MNEIIELLSSSPPRSSGTTVRISTKSDLTEKDIFAFNSDDFNLSGDLDFLSEQPAKRRKPSPEPLLPKIHSASRFDADNVFELSSELDLLPMRTEISKDSAKSAAIKHNVENYDDDVFRFSSSAPEPTLQHRANEPFLIDSSSDDGILHQDPIQTSSQPEAASRPVFSERTANLLAGLGTNNSNLSKRPGKQKPRRSMSVDSTVNGMTKFKKITKPSAVTRDEIHDSSQPNLKTQNPKPVSKSAVRQMQDKADSAKQSKADRDALKEAEKERKRQEKEQKAQEKQRAADIVEANKSKANKKNSTPEMIIDMPASLRGLSVGNQVEEYMKHLNVPVAFSRDEEVDLISDVDVTSGKIIKWRRKILADYDEDLELWKPLDRPRVTSEKHTVVYLKAEELINIAVMGNSGSVTHASDVSEAIMKQNLDTHVALLRTRNPDNTLIYLIEGLMAWNRKSQTVKNRAYTAAVRSQVIHDDPSTATAPVPSQTKRRNNTKRKKSHPAIDLSSITTDTTETILLHLQLHHQPLLIHHTTSPATTASQITAFTQHLSTRPYRLLEQNHNLVSASFCMTTGQIRTGATAHETYINMLQEINRVTPSMAYGISNAGYRNIEELVQGFRKDGNLMLEDVRKSVNKDGAWSDRRLGPMVSKRLFKVFMGRDPGARDGIA